MHLSPQEKDKLLIVTAALLAERRLNRGLKLNHPESVAWLSFLVLEGARDGKSVAELIGRPINSVYQSLSRIRRTLLECVNRQIRTQATP